MTNHPPKHWATRLLGICVVIGAGALAIDHYSHTPRDIPYIPNNPNELDKPNQLTVVLAETGVPAGNKVTTTDGVCTIQVTNITGALAKLTVTTRHGDTHRFDKGVAGARLVVPTPTALYYVDLLSIRSNRVDLTVSKRS